MYIKYKLKFLESTSLEPKSSEFRNVNPNFGPLFVAHWIDHVVADCADHTKINTHLLYYTAKITTPFRLPIGSHGRSFQNGF